MRRDLGLTDEREQEAEQHLEARGTIEEESTARAAGS